jgi:hypothetical protein
MPKREIPATTEYVCDGVYCSNKVSIPQNYSPRINQKEIAGWAMLSIAHADPGIIATPTEAWLCPGCLATHLFGKWQVLEKFAKEHNLEPDKEPSLIPFDEPVASKDPPATTTSAADKAESGGPVGLPSDDDDIDDSPPF